LAIEPEILDNPTVDNSNQREHLLDTWLGLTGQAPMPEGPLVLPVLSGSMRPAINLGSRILIEPCAASACRVGDVTVYLDGDRLVAHRVLWFFGSRKRGWIFQKGDANQFGHWVHSVRIKGVVREVIPTEEDSQVSFAEDPFSYEAARQSRRDYLRNLTLAGPRWIRELIAGRQSKNTEGE